MWVIRKKVVGKYLLRGLFISFISNKKQKQRSCSINYFFKDRNNIFMYNVYDTKRLKRIMQQKSFKGKNVCLGNNRKTSLFFKYEDFFT